MLAYRYIYEAKVLQGQASDAWNNEESDVCGVKRHHMPRPLSPMLGISTAGANPPIAQGVHGVL